MNTNLEKDIIDEKEENKKRIEADELAYENITKSMGVFKKTGNLKLQEKGIYRARKIAEKVFAKYIKKIKEDVNRIGVNVQFLMVVDVEKESFAVYDTHEHKKLIEVLDTKGKYILKCSSLPAEETINVVEFNPKKHI